MADFDRLNDGSKSLLKMTGILEVPLLVEVPLIAETKWRVKYPGDWLTLIG